MPGRPPRRHWLRLAARVLRLVVAPPQQTADLVQRSYDRLAPGYDEAWTQHMRDRSLALLDRMTLPAGATCLDLACGTGFVTSELAGRTGGHVVGVDASPGMLAVAREQHGAHCTFEHADAAAYLRGCAPGSLDVVTCAWGLGYSRPWRVVRAAARVLRPGGTLGIIDNSVFSLAAVLWASLLTFAERPDDLVHVMRVRFLPSAATLVFLLRAAGLAVRASWNGRKSYVVADGAAAIARLTATGAAAGFEFAGAAAQREAVFARFAELLERQSRGGGGVTITHRYLAAIGHKR